MDMEVAAVAGPQTSMGGGAETRRSVSHRRAVHGYGHGHGGITGLLELKPTAKLRESDLVFVEPYLRLFGGETSQQC